MGSQFTGIFKKIDLKNIHMNTQYMWRKKLMEAHHLHVYMLMTWYSPVIILPGLKTARKSWYMSLKWRILVKWHIFLVYKWCRKKRNFCIPKQLPQRYSWKVQNKKLQSGINSSLIFPSPIDSDELMLSRAVENFNRKISALAPVSISARIILMMSNVQAV